MNVGMWCGCVNVGMWCGCVDVMCECGCVNVGMNVGMWCRSVICGRGRVDVMYGRGDVVWECDMWTWRCGVGV